MGLQLRWLGEHNEVPVLHLLDIKIPFNQRLKTLRPLVLTTFAPAGPGALTEFEHLFDCAESLKALRNDYVHGRWAAPGRVVEGAQKLCFARLNWNMEPDRPDDSIEMSLAEFETQVQELEALASDYHRLTKKYAQFARPAKRYERRVASTAVQREGPVPPAT